MSTSDEDERAASDFSEMTQMAARDHQVTGEKVSLYQAHAGRVALLGAGIMLGVTGIFVFIGMSLSFSPASAIAAASLYGLAAVLLIGLSFLMKSSLHIPLIIGLALYIILLGPPLLLRVNLLLYQAIPLLGLVEAIRAAFQHQRFAARRRINALQDDP